MTVCIGIPASAAETSPLKVIVLFAITVLIWGSTWLAIKLHLGVVDPAVSAFYRNTIAALLLFVWCWANRLNLRFPLQDHARFALLGFFLFSGNYYLVYQAAALLTSGLVAVVFSTIIFFNIVTARVFLNAPVRMPVVIGAAFGLAGIGLLFSAELTEISFRDKTIAGLLLALLATLLASLGSILATAMSMRRQLPVVEYNAWAMFYGCVMLLLASWYQGATFNFEMNARYTLSLLYLGVFGTAIGFACYLRLLELIGPARTGYTFLLFPVIALIISTLFEGYRWSASAWAGLACITVGSALALRTRSSPPGGTANNPATAVVAVGGSTN